MGRHSVASGDLRGAVDPHIQHLAASRPIFDCIRNPVHRRSVADRGCRLASVRIAGGRRGRVNIPSIPCPAWPRSDDFRCFSLWHRFQNVALQNNATEPVMKVYGYCRVSTAEQASAGLSLEHQQQQITGYAMMKGWSVTEFFVEAGVSGSVPLAARPEGQRLLKTLQPGDVVITAKLDCAFRSAADALGTLKALKEDKIALHMIDLGGDVTGNGISKLVFTILSAVAENERDRIRERVRDAKRHRVSQRLQRRQEAFRPRYCGRTPCCEPG
jgi:DNA invertase Pin-like site-specific DNA recombinase